jgi:hypothetical protein
MRQRRGSAPAWHPLDAWAQEGLSPRRTVMRWIWIPWGIVGLLGVVIVGLWLSQDDCRMMSLPEIPDVRQVP